MAEKQARFWPRLRGYGSGTSQVVNTLVLVRRLGSTSDEAVYVGKDALI